RPTRRHLNGSARTQSAARHRAAWLARRATRAAPRGNRNAETEREGAHRRLGVGHPKPRRSAARRIPPPEPQRRRVCRADVVEDAEEIAFAGAGGSPRAAQSGRAPARKNSAREEERALRRFPCVRRANTSFPIPQPCAIACSPIPSESSRFCSFHFSPE